MIHYAFGNILKADVEAIVNTMNCVGVMGRGIALQFKKAFPDNFKAYKAVCEAKQVVPGKTFVFDDPRKSGDSHKFVTAIPANNTYIDSQIRRKGFLAETKRGIQK